MPVAWRSGVGQLMERQVPPSMPPMTPEYFAFTNAPKIYAQTTPFFVIALIVVLLRCYVRIFMLKIFHVDDYMMVLSMVLATAIFACFSTEIKHGLGRHFPIVLSDRSLYLTLGKTFWIHGMLIVIGISSVKISIAYFLLRLTGIASRKPYSRFLYGVIVFLVIFTLACLGTIAFQCLPVEAIWDITLQRPPVGTGTARCYSMRVFRNLGLMNGAINVATDALFATLPIPLVWQLQLNLRTKISLMAVLSLGWFACAAGIVKTVFLYHFFDDLDWTIHDSFNIWYYIELTVGIIAASLPSLKPLFNSFLQVAQAITTGSRTKGTARASGYNNRNSLGYQDMGDPSDKSINLQSFTSRGASSTSGGMPYNVRVTAHTGLADKEAWEMVHAKNSDESIRPLQPPAPSHTGILMTKEVRIS